MGLCKNRAGVPAEAEASGSRGGGNAGSLGLILSLISERWGCVSLVHANRSLSLKRWGPGFWECREGKGALPPDGRANKSGEAGTC